MNNVKTNEYYLRKIVLNLEFLLLHTNGLTLEEMRENEILLDSIMFRLVQISENSVRLSEDFKNKYNEIPWHAIKGLRNRIIHEYGDVDLTVIYDTVVRDVPALHAQLSQLI